MAPQKAYAFEEPVAGISVSMDNYQKNHKKSTSYDDPVAGIAVDFERYTESIKFRIYDIPLSAELQQHVRILCLLYPNVSPEMVFAVLDKESDFDFGAKHINKNKTYDAGGMQINSSNFDWLEEKLNITDFYDPKQNLLGGTYMLSIYGGKKNLHKAFTSYNAGPDEIYNLYKKGIYSSRYSRNVVKIMNNLESKKIGGGAISW
jgi:hypothetical protein